MGAKEHLTASDSRSEVSALELWGAGELHDESEAGGAALAVGAMMGLLVALAAFFVVFAPGV